MLGYINVSHNSCCILQQLYELTTHGVSICGPKMCHYKVLRYIYPIPMENNVSKTCITLYTYTHIHIYIYIYIKEKCPTASPWRSNLNKYPHMTGSRQHCTLKLNLLLVHLYFVLDQFQIKRSCFYLVFPTYVQYCTQIIVLLLEPI